MLWLRNENVTESDRSVDEAVCELLKCLLKREPPSLSKLIKGIAQEIALEIPELLVHVATGETLTHPIKAERWHAIQGIGRPGKDVPTLENGGRAESSSDPIDQPVAEEETRNKDEPLLDLVNPPGMEKLRKAIRANSVRDMVMALELVLQEEATQPPIVNYLAKWLKKPSSRAKASTRRWMFGLIGARLVSLCGGDDPKLFDDEELESLYAQVIDNGKSNSQRNGMRYALASFHRYLCKGDPINRPQPLKEIERSEISARVVTHDEYQRSLEMLGRPGPTDEDPQWLLACQIALILFFRLGLRRRELLWLPLHDVHGEFTIEILVRPFKERTLKTTNALRTLMVNGFLWEMEFGLVQEWLKRRRNEELVNEEDFYFFSLTQSERAIISEARIIERIVDALRAATGDQDIHIHHLRHSFATWSVLSLVGEAIEDDFGRWSHLPETQQWLRSFPATIKQYYLREAPQRDLVSLISTLMGHSTPAITMEYYIHSMDYLLGIALNIAFGVEPGEIGANGFGLPLRTYRRWSKSGWSGLLELLAKRYTKRWTMGEVQRVRVVNKQSKTMGALYERYYTLWQALKWADKHGDLDSSSTLSMEVDVDELAQWRKRVAQLQENGFLSKGYPSFPHGNSRETTTEKYTQLFEAAMSSRDGKMVVDKICTFWLKYKIKARGALRFRDPDEAREYIDCLLALGIPWSQINLTWIGSRFTQREAKAYRVHWRNGLGLSKRIKIGEQSIHNDRPLGKSKGYMDIRVINESDQKLDAVVNASKEIQWVIMMAIITNVCGLTST